VNDELIILAAFAVIWAVAVAAYLVIIL